MLYENARDLHLLQLWPEVPSWVPARLWDSASLGEMLQPLSWPGCSRNRRELCRRSSPEDHHIRGGGCGSVCLPWSSVMSRNADSEREYVRNKGDRDVTVSLERGAELASKTRNIAWELERCSSSHQVAFSHPLLTSRGVYWFPQFRWLRTSSSLLPGLRWRPTYYLIPHPL